jgi:hypothetical protein
VLATGKGLQSAGAHAGAAGALTLRLALSKAGRQALLKAKQRKLRVKVTIAFTPSGSAAALTATKVVTFVARPGRKHHSRHRRH